MKHTVFFLLILSFCLLPNGLAQTVVVPLDDGFYVIPIGCPLKPDNCAANPICDRAKVVDSGDARVIIATDMAGIGGITKSDPDDIQSFVHFLTFADKVDIEGITTSPPRTASVSNNTQSIARLNDIIGAYNSDRQKLINNYGDDFPTANYLYSIVKGGSVNYHPINESNSQANNDAVNHIIERARCGWHNGDKRPLYLLSWGSANDIAQALYNAPDIAPVVRLVTQSRGNDGVFQETPGSTTNQLSCSPHRSTSTHPDYIHSCDTWNYLRSIVDNLWWVDFTGYGAPTKICDQTKVNAIKAGGTLGSKIIDTYNSPHYEKCNDHYGGVYSGDTYTGNNWLKIGDTWTVMFTHNPAPQRSNPTTSLDYGEIYQPEQNLPNYFQLYQNELKNRINASQEWKARADKL